MRGKSILGLVVYSAVHLGHFINLIPKTGASKIIIALAFGANFSVLIVFGVQTYKDNPFELYLLAGFIGISILIEIYMQKRKSRTIKPATKDTFSSLKSHFRI